MEQSNRLRDLRAIDPLRNYLAHLMYHKINDAHLLCCDGTRAESHNLCPAFTILAILLYYPNSLIDAWLYIELFET